MHFLSLKCSLLLIVMCMIMQQQNVAAKPFIFKFFVPQAPARTDSSSSSASSYSTGIDFGSILSTKLNLLTSLLRTKLNSAASFNFGFKTLQPTTTRRPYTSTTINTPEDEFEPESTTKAGLKTTSITTTTTTTAAPAKVESGSDNLSEPINSNNKDSATKGTTITKTSTTVTDSTKTSTISESFEGSDNQNGNGYTTSKVTTVRNQNNGYNYPTTKTAVNSDNQANGNDYTTSSSNSNGYGNAGQQSGYNYDYSNQGMSENEISNEIMAISNQYLPAF